jgi:hypothetical protein
MTRHDRVVAKSEVDQYAETVVSECIEPHFFPLFLLRRRR